jgi:hypothetical protein
MKGKVKEAFEQQTEDFRGGLVEAFAKLGDYSRNAAKKGVEQADKLDASKSMPLSSAKLRGMAEVYEEMAQKTDAIVNDVIPAFADPPGWLSMLFELADEVADGIDGWEKRHERQTVALESIAKSLGDKG